MARGKRNRFNIWDVLIYGVIGMLSVFFLYPIWYCLITSLSSGKALLRSLPLLWPRNFTFEAYRYIFTSEANIFAYYRNTIFYAVVGTAISLTLTSMMAYPFIVKDFIGKVFLNVYMVITMFFGGGLLPYFILVSELGLRNTIWVMLIPGAVGAYTVIIFRTFFNSVPASLREAAYIDGAGHYRVLAQILVPVSKPLFATFALFGMVGKWNEWFTPFLFITREELKPIQVFLRESLVTINGLADQFSVGKMAQLDILPQNIRTAIVIITIAPILCVYPFLQKYFASGIMIGSIKA